MRARDLFNLGAEDIKNYFNGTDLRREINRDRKVYPTTKEEALFGLSGYMRSPRKTGRKLIKKFPILQVEMDNDGYATITLHLRGKEIFLNVNYYGGWVDMVILNGKDVFDYDSRGILRKQ